MGESIRIKEAFNAVSVFLNPVFQRDNVQDHKSRGKSLLEILGETLREDDTGAGSVRRDVISKALDLLGLVHTAFVTPVNDVDPTSQHGQDTEDAALEDAKRRRLLLALVDLISLEGIYPSLSRGLGVPLHHRVFSALPTGVIAQQQHHAQEKPEDEFLLEKIWLALSSIIFDARPSIQDAIHGRILSDMISAVSDLAYNSTSLSHDKEKAYRQDLVKLIEGTPSPTLLSTLSSFLQSDPAPWFKSLVSGQLSHIPLRPGGVVQTMVFLASQFAPSLGAEAQTQASSGPVFTVQGIMQTSRLLSSVPEGMDPVKYFSTIAPQLLALIDGDDPDLRKTAAYVIGNGILGKRAYGAPGTIGYSIFLEPIFKALTAGLNAPSKQWLALPGGVEHDSLERIEVTEPVLVLAVDRLRSLVLQPPNPGLVKRVVHPVLLPLWGLACYSLEHQHTALHEKILTVLQTYFGISIGPQPLQKLVDNLLWDGGSTWTYGSDTKNGITLQKRSTTEPNRNIVRLVDILESRTKLFISLLGADPSSEERTADIFLYASERWLVKPSTNTRSVERWRLSRDENNFSDMIQRLACAKVAETLLGNFQDALSRYPLRILELTKQIIDSELNRAYVRSKRTMGGQSGKVSLSSLANIVEPDEAGKEETTAGADSAESLSAVFSLLSTVLASPEFNTSPETLPVLEAIKSKVDELIPHLPSELSKPATTASMLVEIHIATPEGQTTNKPSSEVADFETHRRALTNLNSDLPPVQAEGFSLLSGLITKASPVLDIPSTLTLLLSIITDPSETNSSDEFIYLNAIKLIGTLASRHSRTVIKTLVDRYIDKSETNSLDQRLKIGESLLRAVQDLGTALTGETSKILSEGMISVAGRRAQKPEAQKARQQHLDKEKRKQEREARQNKEPSMPPGWSISTAAAASISKIRELTEEDSDNPELEPPEQAANIISAWAAGAVSGEEPEDLRIRASALSILASAIQTNISGLGPSIVSSAVELALATLTLEPELESAILRRASVVLLLDILKAMDTARETGGSQALGFGFSLSDNASMSGRLGDAQDMTGGGATTVGNIPRMLSTLNFVESRESDSIVRGHIRVLIESLEAWLEKSLLWGIGARDEDEPRLELGNRIAGLRINPLSDKGEAARPRIEEIE
ncbi:protein required for cell viability [Aspergillus sclerotioniger CBS 115572]|uniref:Protein required for cell viability n=1 Tax=Aspergillus sclerotioniger CBS 115572 TaxID=1450535 RepID=A0A317WZE5_9EURO|nr:protein required for cell viability [Aspergillus sclerotioniger CBS 115572]PWY91754.1 protein required for cell viability [Aspergillus sclerotioniger CBS 115572]